MTSLTSSPASANPALNAFALGAFGPFDIRGKVGENGFDATAFYRLGRALGQIIAQEFPNLPIVIGHDARTHAFALSRSLLRGLTEEGILAYDLGLAATPLVYFAEWVSHQSAESSKAPLPPVAGCLVVTASHNPAPYNGLKFSLNQTPTTPERMAELKTRYLKLCEAGVLPHAPLDETKITPLDLKAAYIEALTNEFASVATGLKLVIDCGNGTAGPLARSVFEGLGAEVIGLFEPPDGTFPNRSPDPCRAENLTALAEAVRANGADLGLAFDGDSDRLAVVDETGNMLSSDTLLAIYAAQLVVYQAKNKAAKNKAVVCEIKAPGNLLAYLSGLGLEPQLSKTGHVFMKQQMRATGALLGGELSGHYFFKDNHPGYDDAFYAAARLLAWIKAENQAQPMFLLSSTHQLLPQSFVSDEKRVHCQPGQGNEWVAALKKSVDSGSLDLGLPVEALLELDGLRVQLPGGFVLLRASNTEPVVSLRYEAPTETAFLRLEATLNGWVASICNKSC